VCVCVFVLNGNALKYFNQIVLKLH